MSNSNSRSGRRLSRRDFLKMAGIGFGATVLAGCTPATPAATKAAEPTPLPTAVPPTKPPEVSPTEVPVATEVVGPTPDANGCAIDWYPTTPDFTPLSPPVEISIPWAASYTFAVEGDELTNNPTYNRIVEKLGIKYTVAWQADGNEYYTRLNNDLAAGSLPDGFRCRNRTLPQFIDIDAVEDITDIWEATASDLVKSKKGYPDSLMWLGVTRNKRIYGIAYNEDGLGSDSLSMVRQDWLDQVEMPAPTTLDEWTAVAKAFKDAGLAEYPIAACMNLITWDFALDPVFGAYGIMPTYWLKNADGTLSYGSINTAVKDALAVLNGWYNDGLINPDFINLDESGPGDAFMAGQIGLCFQPWWAGHANIWDLYAAFPEAKIAVIPNPKGPDGKSGRAGTSLATSSAMIFKKGVDPKKVEAVIHHINWQVEMHVNFEKYQQYGEWLQGAAYFRGYEWDLDASCNMTIGLTPGSEWAYSKDMLGGYRGCSYPEYPADCFTKMAEWLKADPASLNMAQKFILADASTQRDIEYYNIAIDTRDEILPNAFSGARNEAMNAVYPDLVDLENTAYLEFITGARKIDDFDAFVQEWMDRGGTIMTEEINKWAQGS